MKRAGLNGRPVLSLAEQLAPLTPNVSTDATLAQAQASGCTINGKALPETRGRYRKARR